MHNPKPTNTKAPMNKSPPPRRTKHQRRPTPAIYPRIHSFVCPISRGGNVQISNNIKQIMLTIQIIYLIWCPNEAASTLRGDKNAQTGRRWCCCWVRADFLVYIVLCIYGNENDKKRLILFEDHIISAGHQPNWRSDKHCCISNYIHCENHRLMEPRENMHISKWISRLKVY